MPKRVYASQGNPVWSVPDYNCQSPVDSEKPIAKVSPVLAGAIAEQTVITDLLTRGFKVYAPVVRNKSHDLIAVDSQHKVFTIEVRTVRRLQDGRLTAFRKKTDFSDVYAVVVKGEPIRYEPDLPQQ